jgi:hypothetical protein
MWNILKKLVLVVLLVGAAGGILFAAAFLQEFHGKDIESRLPGLGLKLPLKDPRIEISCFRFVLELYDGDTLIKRYEAGFGRAPVSGRIGKDVASTPQGEYRVIRKEIRTDILKRGSRFIVLDYPNTGDGQRAFEVGLISRAEFDEIKQRDRDDAMPPLNTPLGGPMGIQGNFFFFRERHFTDGSVAISNGDINELFDYVAVGTPVIIKD